MYHIFGVTIVIYNQYSFERWECYRRMLFCPSGN